MPIIDIKSLKEKESFVSLPTSHIHQDINTQTLYIMPHILQVWTTMPLNIKKVFIYLKGNTLVRMWMMNMITMIT